MFKPGAPGPSRASCKTSTLKDTKYYTFGENKNEQTARAYWAKIKGEDKV